MDILNLWSQCLLYKVILKFPMLETNNISLVCWYIIVIWPVMMADCSIQGQNIGISFWPNRALLGAWWWSTLRAASHSFTLHLMLHNLVDARNQAEWTELSKVQEFPLHSCVEFCLVCSQLRLCFWVSHHATYCARLLLTSYRPIVHACSHFWH